MLISKKKSFRVNPRILVELALIFYLLVYGPISPLLPLAIGYHSVSDNLNTVYYYGDNRDTALNVLDLTNQIQSQVLDFWGNKGLYPAGVKVYLSSPLRFFHTSMYNKNSTAFIQGNSIVINLEKGGKHILPILRHEMSHHYISQITMGFITRYLLPRWLDEGLAVVFSGEIKPSRAMLATYLLNHPDPISITDLNSGIQWYRSFQTSQWEISYTYSREIVSYLLNKYGKDKYLQIIRNIGLFHPYPQVISEQLGIDIQQLERQFRNYILN